MLDTLSAREKDAVALYDEVARRGDVGDAPVWIDDFTASLFCDLKVDDEVVDIGCRVGRFVPLLPQLGISNYLGIDPSEESIAYCRRTFSGAEGCNLRFEVGEARLMGTTYPRQFAGFMLVAVLMHIPRSDAHIALKSIRACLKDGAIGLFSTPEAYEGKLEVVNRQGMSISLYTEEELSRLFASTGFRFDQMIDSGPMIFGRLTAV